MKSDTKAQRLTAAFRGAMELSVPTCNTADDAQGVGLYRAVCRGETEPRDVLSSVNAIRCRHG